jgi:hypothetical protein
MGAIRTIIKYIYDAKVKNVSRSYGNSGVGFINRNRGDGPITSVILDETLESIAAQRLAEIKMRSMMQESIEQAKAHMVELAANARRGGEGQTVIIQEYAYNGIDKWATQYFNLVEQDTYEALNYAFDYWNWRQLLEEACEGSPKADAITIIIDEAYNIIYETAIELRKYVNAIQWAMEATIDVFANFFNGITNNRSRTSETISARTTYLAMVKWGETPSGKAYFEDMRRRTIDDILKNPRKASGGYDLGSDLLSGKSTGSGAIDSWVSQGNYRKSLPGYGDRSRQNLDAYIKGQGKVWKWNGYKDVLVDYGRTK